MSTLTRVFKIAGDIGDDVVVDPRGRRIKGLETGDVTTVLDFDSRFEGRSNGVGVPAGL